MSWNITGTLVKSGDVVELSKDGRCWERYCTIHYGDQATAAVKMIDGLVPDGLFARIVRGTEVIYG